LTEWLFVWTGGALFVTSLVVCAASYAFRWSVDMGGGWPAVALDAALVTLFAGHHSVFARDGVKAWLEGRVRRRLLRSLYVWTASLLFLGVCLAWYPIGHELYHASGLQIWLHGLTQLLGIALIARVVRDLDPLELAGIRQATARSVTASGDQFLETDRHASKVDQAAVDRRTPAINESASKGGVRKPAPHRLTTTGPYGLVRHPLYLGWVLCVFGAAHMTGDRLAFALLTTLYLAIAIPWEERSLIGEFGAEYRRYQQLVRWRMIPFIY
jgi:hypothetical protein